MSPNDAPEPPPQPRYEIEEEIGRGGMGAVYRVYDRELRRTLAMKILREDAPETSQDATPLARFLEEAQVTAQLDHPGIVPVHEVGRDGQGRLYFTMQLVKGRDFKTILDLVHRGEEGWTLTRAVGVLLKVCEAMTYAHDKAVLHRDLKPSNVMVGKYGEVYVMDWGLALAHRAGAPAPETPPPGMATHAIRTDWREFIAQESPTDGTMTGMVLGTPHYMPPEQAAARRDIGPHSDVYAVGAMLYHLLSGTMPYHTPGDLVPAAVVLAMVLQGPPRPLADVARNVPGELVAICERAMARDITQRYRAMSELADDLRAYLEGRVVRAYEAGAIAQFKKWVRRNKGLAAAIAAALVIALGGLGGIAQKESQRRREQSQLNAQLAEKNTSLEQRNADLVAARDDADHQAAEARVERDVAQHVEQFMIGLFQAPDPDLAQGKEVTAKSVLDRGVQSAHVLEGQPLVRARLLSAMGQAYQAIGKLSDAQPLLEEVVQEYTHLYGEDAVVTAGAMNTLATLYTLQDQLARALPLYERSLAVYRRTRDADDLDRLAAVANLANVYRGSGRLREAEALMLEALEGFRRVRGEDDRNTLGLMNNLATLYKMKAKPEQAEPLFRKAAESFARLVGDDHTDTLTARNNLALMCQALGKTDEAERIYADILDRCVRVLGETHPLTITVTLNLGAFYDQRGLLDEAEDYYRRSLAAARQTLGLRHSDTLGALAALAGLLHRMGRDTEAEAFARELVEHAPPNTLAYQNGKKLFDEIAHAMRDRPNR